MLFKLKNDSVKLSQFIKDNLPDTIALLIKTVANADPTITSCLDGVHSVGSVHKDGLAIDIRINDWKCDIKTLSHAISFVLPDNWFTVLEKDHLHIQFGSKNIIDPSKKFIVKVYK